ncbi:MAG: hypothetical protein ACJ74W_21235 [Pyrinomonadaceae bacterium]
MDNSRFEDHLNTASANDNPGDLFQQFVYEVLCPEYAGLHVFPGGGKDGGIDLVQTTSEPRLIVECKYIGEAGLIEAQKRWRTVAGNLSKHIVDPNGPTTGQAQYAPWYRSAPPISEYVFCISSVLGNQANFEQLHREITDFFVRLGTAHTHLAHLINISVTVLDWNDLWTRLQRHPSLLFKWFPSSCPRGLVPLDRSAERGTFRSYLSNDKLSYYGRGQHLRLAPGPQGTHISDEEELLAQLDGGDSTGLIVTGRGGVGKTRLTLELGRLAQRKGWLVLRVLSTIKVEALERLAATLIPTTPALLLIDYVETQSDFAQLVETLNELNDVAALRLRYVANCRTNYYRNTLSMTSSTFRHKLVDLSLHTPDPEHKRWLEGYRGQTVRHILTESGLEVTDNHLRICRDVPVLAVFMSYLHSTGREDDLKLLLEAPDFSSWVNTRVRLSFGVASISRDLALLIALLPMPGAITFNLEREKYGSLLDKLATDGWIEKLLPDALHPVERWEAAHDVLADQVLLSYLESIPHTVEHFLRDLFALARQLGCLRTALITLQRLVDKPVLSSLDWSTILDREMGEQPAAWREARDLLIRTPFLTPPQRIGLLGKHEEIWAGAEEEVDFQNALGWLARWAQEQEKDGQNLENRDTLISWIQKAASLITRSNFVLTYGVKFCPEVVREPALNWIRARPHLFQTHYLIAAWLEHGMGTEIIASSVKQWVTSFNTISHLSFVAKAWLNAGGEKDLIRDAVAAWLTQHKTEAEAGFVYRSWLDAGGEKDLIRDAIVAWLSEHKTDAEAQFVYKSWLDAGGNKELVREAIVAWLSEHKTDAGADFVYRGWLDAGGEFSLIRSQAIEWFSQNCEKPEALFLSKHLAKQREIPVETVKDILRWCQHFPTDEDVLWRLTQLRTHLISADIAEEVCITAEIVLEPLFATEGSFSPITKEQINFLFSYLFENPNLLTGQLRSRVDALFIKWLRSPASFSDDIKPHINVQRVSYVWRVVELLDAGVLDVVTDREHLIRFTHWVNLWDAKWRARLRPAFTYLMRHHPATGLWDSFII